MSWGIVGVTQSTHVAMWESDAAQFWVKAVNRHCGWAVTPAVKVPPEVASHGGLPGLPGLKGMSGPGKAPVSYVREAVRRMWEWLKVGM